MIYVWAILLTLGVLAFTMAVRQRDIPVPAPVPPGAYLEEKKARIYENLRDLQFEYRVGKLSDADYQATKRSLQTELAAVLAELDAVVPAATAAAAAPAKSAKKAAAQVCPHCGARFAQSLKFCGECGKSMAGAATA